MKYNKPNFLALTPILVFLALTAGFSLVLGSARVIDVLLFFMIASFVAIAMNRERNTMDKIDTFARGASNENTVIMIMIFLLAGSFGAVAKDGGGVESVVNLFLTYIPEFMLVPGLFLVSSLVGLSLGTSIGTAVALTPIGVGIAESTGIPVALALGAILGGASLGDNLSVISDTTIAATRICGVEMRDKFRVNFLIVLPAGIITMIIYGIMTMGTSTTLLVGSYKLLQVLPFAFVLIASLMGMNVFYVLLSGIILAGGIGMYYNAFEHEFGQFIGFLTVAQNGMLGMTRISIVVLIVGGIIGIIQYNGGIDWLIQKVEKRASGPKSGMVAIIVLTILVTIFVATSTVGIVTIAPIAVVLGKKFGIDPRRTAAYLDIYSTSTMANLPWGGMFLGTAATATAVMTSGSLDPVQLIKYSTYSHVLMIVALIFLFLDIPKLKPMKEKLIDKEMDQQEV